MTRPIQTPTGDECPACGSRQFRPVYQVTDRLFHTTDKEFTIVECSGCGMLRLFPWPPPEELRRYYPASYWFDADTDSVARVAEAYRRTVVHDHVGFVKRALDRAAVKGPWLDVGCGGGLFTRLLAERGVKAFGLDISEDAARVAWSRNRVPVACAALHEVPYAPETFAGITMFHVLEHLYDPASYLDAARRLLKPGGTLVVQVPNASSWQFLLFGRGWNGLDVPRHLVDYRSRDLQALLRHAGFEIAREKFFSLRDNPAGFASSLAPGLDPMARRVRGLRESAPWALIKDGVYFLLVLAGLPLAALEAACRAGSTVMVEARKPS